MSIQENIRKDLDALKKRVSEQDFPSAIEALRKRKYAKESTAFQKILRQQRRAVPQTRAREQRDDGYGYYTDVQQQAQRIPLPPPLEIPRQQRQVARPSLAQIRTQDNQNIIGRLQQQYFAEQLAARLRDSI